MKWRALIISVFMILLTFLSLGAVKEFGNDIKYPVQAAFSLTDSGATNKTEVFDKIEDLASKHNLQVYRPFIDGSGQQRTFVFNPTNNDTDYETDVTLLSTSNVSGMYYTSKSVPQNFQEELGKFGLTLRANDLTWYLIPVYFLFTNLRSLAVWTLFFVFSLALLAIKLMYVKKDMIYRSLGLFGKVSSKDFFQDIVTVLLLYLLILLGFIVYQGTWSNVFVKSFNLLMGTNLIILMSLIGCITILYRVHLTSIKPLSILKNKSVTGFILVVWLIGIFLSSVIFGVTLQKSLDTLSQSKTEIEALDKWKSVANFAEVTWFDLSSEYTNGENQIDSDFIKEQNLKYKQFILSFNEADILYSKASVFTGEQLSYAPEQIKQELLNRGIDSNLTDKIRYVNQGMIIKNQTIFPHNQYGNGGKDAAGVIYIPENQMEKLESVKALIDYEWFQYSNIKADQFTIQTVPKGQKNFLFNHKATEKELFAKQEVTDAILVELNFAYFDNETLDAHFFNIAQDSIYQQEVIQIQTSKVGLTEFSGLTNVAEKVLLERNRIQSQLIGSLLSLFILSIAQCYIIYEYIVTLLKKNSKKISIYTILGINSVTLLGKILLPLLLSIVISSMSIWLLTNSIVISGIIGLFYLIELTIMSFFAQKSIKIKRLQILKGDFEAI